MPFTTVRRSARGVFFQGTVTWNIPGGHAGLPGRSKEKTRPFRKLPHTDANLFCSKPICHTHRFANLLFVNLRAKSAHDAPLRGGGWGAAPFAARELLRAAAFQQGC